MIFLVYQYVLVSLEVSICLQSHYLLVHLLEHLHEHFSSDFDLSHCLYLFPDVVSLMLSEKGASVAHHGFARYADELTWLAVSGTILKNKLLGLLDLRQSRHRPFRRRFHYPLSDDSGLSCSSQSRCSTLREARFHAQQLTSKLVLQAHSRFFNMNFNFSLLLILLILVSQELLVPIMLHHVV